MAILAIGSDHLRLHLARGELGSGVFLFECSREQLDHIERAQGCIPCLVIPDLIRDPETKQVSSQERQFCCPTRKSCPPVSGRGGE